MHKLKGKLWNVNIYKYIYIYKNHNRNSSLQIDLRIVRICLHIKEGANIQTIQTGNTVKK